MKILKTKKYSILSNILKYSFMFILVVSVSSQVFAVEPDVSGSTTPDVSGSGMNITTKIENPLGDKITDIPKFIQEAIKIVLTVGIPLIALAIIYTGFLFVEAQGNPEKLSKAKKALIYTLIGGALLLGAFVIANAIGATVDDIKKSA